MNTLEIIDEYDTKYRDAMDRIVTASNEVEGLLKSVARDFAPAGHVLVNFGLGEFCACFEVEYGPTPSHATMSLSVPASNDGGCWCGESENDEWMDISPSEFRRRLLAAIANEESRRAITNGREHRLASRFLALPFRRQIAVAMSLGVLTDEDRALNDEELFSELFKRARSRGLLAKLWDETEKRHADRATFNPFEGDRGTHTHRYKEDLK